MSRYVNDKIFNNSLEFYSFLRKERGDLRNIVQYATPTLRTPTKQDRRSIRSTAHMWAYGDRFYKLADQYYNNVDYWWVIAWWNGYPTESDVPKGGVIYIPLDLEMALRAMRAA